MSLTCQKSTLRKTDQHPLPTPSLLAPPLLDRTAGPDPNASSNLSASSQSGFSLKGGFMFRFSRSLRSGHRGRLLLVLSIFLGVATGALAKEPTCQVNPA